MASASATVPVAGCNSTTYSSVTKAVIKPFPLTPMQARRRGMPANLTKEQKIALKHFRQQVTHEETEAIRARGEAVELLHLKWLLATDVSHAIQARTHMPDVI